MPIQRKLMMSLQDQYGKKEGKNAYFAMENRGFKRRPKRSMRLIKSKLR